MVPDLPAQLEWIEPWQLLEGSGDAFVRELQKEVSSQHVLNGLSVIAVARRIDRDDVLFVTPEPTKPLAVVHLTWASRTEADPQCPYTTIYESWQDWIDQCLLPDHKEYSVSG